MREGGKVLFINNQLIPNSNPPLNPPGGDLKSLKTREFVPLTFNTFNKWFFKPPLGVWGNVPLGVWG